jgi:hypothetical protein
MKIKKMNSIEELQNLVGLMQQALKFYADKNNYFTSQKVSNNPAPSMIMLDGGSQAQFALDLAKKLADQNQKIQDEYDKLIMETENLEPTGETNPLDLINVFIQSRDDKNI